jgi:uncharacterized protein with ACT and thioredoxin-like domain
MVVAELGGLVEQAIEPIGDFERLDLLVLAGSCVGGLNQMND